MESSNCENDDPQISEEQKQILERLKCLNNGENTIHQSAVRLNFGLKNTDATPLSNSTVTAQASPSRVKPPPGFSQTLQPLSSLGQGGAGAAISCLGGAGGPSGSLDIGNGNGGNLSSLRQTAEGSVSGGSGLKLGALQPCGQGPSSGLSFSSLASSHLSSSSLSNTQLKLPHLSSLSNSDSSGSKPSLNALASSHLASNTTGGFKLGSLAGASGSTSSKLSLNALASNHLSSGQGRSTFQIPSLFNGEQKPIISNTDNRSDSPVHGDINLLSALRLASPEKVTEEEEIKIVNEPPEEVIDLNIFVTSCTFGRLRSVLTCKSATSFGSTVNRKWRRKTPYVKSHDFYAKYRSMNVFKFDTPSPDDVVLEAQKQSKAFNRLNIS